MHEEHIGIQRIASHGGEGVLTLETPNPDIEPGIDTSLMQASGDVPF